MNIHPAAVRNQVHRLCKQYGVHSLQALLQKIRKMPQGFAVANCAA